MILVSFFKKSQKGHCASSLSVTNENGKLKTTSIATHSRTARKSSSKVTELLSGKKVLAGILLSVTVF